MKIRNKGMYLFVLFLLIIYPVTIFAFETIITHPEITLDSLDEYDVGFPSSQRENLKDGSIDEDSPDYKVLPTWARYYNHYLGPDGNGWWIGSSVGHAANAETFALRTGVQRSWVDKAVDELGNQAFFQHPFSSKDQIAFIDSNIPLIQDFSWDQAKSRYDYNKNFSYLALGHVAHLLEDMGVPAHVWNDTHIFAIWDSAKNLERVGDPFEFIVEDKFIDQGRPVITHPNLVNECSTPECLFENLSAFTRDNFFSLSNVDDEHINRPWKGGTWKDEHYCDIVKDPINKKKYLGCYVLDEFGDYIYYYAARKGYGNLYFLDERVHSDYWNLIYPQVTRYVASLVSIFHNDVGYNPYPSPIAPTVSTPIYCNGQITTTWSAVNDAVHYVLYWSNSPNINISNSVRIFPVNDTQYVHAGVTPGSTYYYRVAAINGSGEGLLSNEVSFGPVPSAAPAQQAGTWAKYADMPFKLDGPPVAVNGKIYAFGGWDTNRVLEYDPMTNVWTEKAGMPRARGGTVALEYNGKVLVAGGNPTPWGSSELDVYDPAQNNWTTKSPMPYQWGGWGVAGGIINDKMYVVGGYNWYSHDETYCREYDITNDAWTLKTNMPIAVSWMNSSVINDKLYVVGGGYGTGNISWTNKIQTYDKYSNTWQASLDFPIYSSGSGVIPYNNILYVIGGLNMVPPFPFYWNGVVDNIHSFNNMNIYTIDPILGIVTSISVMPVIDGGQVVVVGNVLYLVGSGGSGQELWGFGLP